MTLSRANLSLLKCSDDTVIGCCLSMEEQNGRPFTGSKTLADIGVGKDTMKVVEELKNR